MEEAQALGMRVWVFDDGAYPSGRAGTLMRDRHPGLLKVYLARHEIEAQGPMPAASFLVGAWIEKGESLVGVVAGRRRDAHGETLDADSLVDLTDRVRDGTLRWDVPAGFWRVFVLVRTRNGGEEWTRDSLNPLVAEAGQAFITEVHEAHRARYGRLFGTTFAGFFTDEPRFGNKPVYDAVLGDVDMVIPWCDDLLGELDARWSSSAVRRIRRTGTPVRRGVPAPFRRLLPALWHDAGEVSHRARALYMDVVSARFGRNFSAAIGDWCRAHGVRFIGHVVEDNSAHARLGHGAGHFFRALQGQDMAGLDLVSQVWPGFPEGRILTPFGPWDLDFFRWGIAKMASSAAHADPRKAGLTMCEIFGAYGWQLGLRDMKWLTDFACSRGVNFLVPHAFSPKFPDPDCPPHFHARGANPQWRLFGHWSSYAERLCHLLSGGEHRASAAVLYHAEAEWAGECERFEESVRTLAVRQIDCDVVCIDTLLDPAVTRVGQGSLAVNKERFSCLVVPFARRLPSRFLRFLPSLLRAGVPVVFTGEVPGAASDTDLTREDLAAISRHPLAAVVPTVELADALLSRGIKGVTARPEQSHLRTYRYRRSGMDMLFCFNEDTRLPVDTWLSIDDPRRPFGYDALTDMTLALEGDRQGEEWSVHLRLEPYGSLFLVLADTDGQFSHSARLPAGADLEPAGEISGHWVVATRESEAGARDVVRPSVAGPGDISAAAGLESFAGIVIYESEVDIASGRAWLDLGRVGESSEAWLDGAALGTRIYPPHFYDLGTVTPGRHVLRIEVTTTLARRLGGNVFDRAMAQEPVGLVGPVRILRARGEARG